MSLTQIIVDIFHRPKNNKTTALVLETKPQESQLRDNSIKERLEQQRIEFLNAYATAALIVNRTTRSEEIELFSFRMAEEARRGKDPRTLLNLTEVSDTILPALKQDVQNSPETAFLLNEYKENVLKQVGRFYTDTFYSKKPRKPIELIENLKNVSEEDKDKLAGIISIEAPKYIQENLKYLQSKINRALKIYDVKRKKHNIVEILNKAKTSATAGDIEKTQTRLGSVKFRATADWSKEMQEVAKLAYKTNFDRNIEKANKAFGKEKVSSGFNFLKEAQIYAKDAGIKFDANNSEIFRKYLSKNGLRTYDWQFEGHKLVNVLSQYLSKINQ